MKLLTAFLLAISVLFTSCASMLNGKYQKIVINKDASDEILINGKTPKTKDGKYLLQRNYEPKQITVKSEGYKDHNMVIMQYKKSPLYIMSWIPFGVTVLAPFNDNGVKSWDYSNKPITYTKIKQIPEKLPEQKKIIANQVKVELDQEKIKYRYFPTYRNFLNKVEKKDAKTSKTEENLKFESPVFQDQLNSILAEHGYIDTTRALSNSFLENIYINATINEYTLHNIKQHISLTNLGMLYSDLTIKWEILDYYKKPIHTLTTKQTSSQFAVLNTNKYDEVVNLAAKDCVESSLIEFMKDEKVQAYLIDKSEIEEEKKLTTINLYTSNAYVSGLSESVKSTLTIKTKEGFGSGFIISSDGYIITNYHVVSDTTDMKVILNDKSEHKAEVVRISKINDLALIKINANGLTPFKILNDKDVNIGSEVYAIGTPSAEDLSQTISRGIISGLRDRGTSKLIQTDASVNSGNSGGPIINKQGEVIGIVSSKLKGVGVEGVAFGIPAYEISESLKVKIQ